MASEAERLEADVRRLMAQHAAIKPRGFNTIRQRANLHDRIDALLDQIASTGSSDPWQLAIAAATPGDQGNPLSIVCGLCKMARYYHDLGALLCRECDGRIVPAPDALTELDGAE